MMRVSLLALCLMLLSACDYFKPSRLQVPTTDISMEAPRGYSVSQRFPGIENTANDGSFTVNSFPRQAIGSLGEMFASVERATPTLHNRGISVEGTETIQWNDKPVLLFRGTQKNEENILYEKWIAVFIDERPIMIAFQEPRPGKLTKDEVVKAFASVRVERDTR